MWASDYGREDQARSGTEEGVWDKRFCFNFLFLAVSRGEEGQWLLLAVKLHQDPRIDDGHLTIP